MSQHDMNIANQGFPAFRADLNDALAALVSNNSGASAPATTFANMPWYDTTNNIFKIRNEDNDAWISVFTLDQSTDAITAIGSVTLADVVSLTGTQTLTNKTLTSPTLTNPTVDKINTGIANAVIGAGNASIMKNRIINGAMVIDQRNAGASIAVADSNVYPIDRFLFRNATDGTATAQQSSTIPTGGGFVNSVVYTVGTADASLAAGQYARIAQVIEGYNFADLQWGTASAKTITISFWVRSSVTGTYSVTLYNSAADRGYAANYTISAANTWEQKTVTIAGDTSGTWLTTNGKGVTVNFGLGAGTDYQLSAGSWTATSNIPLASTTQTNLMATAGATFYITGVQLEVGSSATGYEYENYTSLLQKCQRYYYKFVNNNGTGTAWWGQATTSLSTTRSIGIPITLPVPARTTPSFASSNLKLVPAQVNTTYAVTAASVYSGYSTYGTAFAIDMTTSGISAGTVYFLYLPDAGYVEYSMEL